MRAAIICLNGQPVLICPESWAMTMLTKLMDERPLIKSWSIEIRNIIGFEEVLVCPKCSKPVDKKEALTYGGKHEDCSVPELETRVSGKTLMRTRKKRNKKHE